MSWTSGEVMIWMAAFVAVSWSAPRRFHPHAVGAFALAFLARADGRSLAALLGLSLACRVLAPRPGIRGWRVAAVVLLAAGLLAWTRRVGTGDPGPMRSVAFLGLSYYALRAVHVAVERFKGQLRPTTLAEDIAFLGFFPALVAGPIHRCREFLHDQNRRRWDRDLFAEGLERILYGFAKIVVAGNYLLTNVAGLWLESAGLPPWLDEYLSILILTANGYFQFAGYSDVAVGLGNLAGYRLPENFNWPFLATNIRDFWQRWHASLSLWCRDYVFAPATARFRTPYAGVVLSMVVLALWHEISFRYLLWGLWHAAGIAAWHAFQSLKGRLPPLTSRPARAVVAVLACLLTLNFFALGFEITRSATPAEAWKRYVTIFTLKGDPDV